MQKLTFYYRHERQSWTSPTLPTPELVKKQSWHECDFFLYKCRRITSILEFEVEWRHVTQKRAKSVGLKTWMNHLTVIEFSEILSCQNSAVSSKSSLLWDWNSNASCLSESTVAIALRCTVPDLSMRKKWKWPLQFAYSWTKSEHEKRIRRLTWSGRSVLSDIGQPLLRRNAGILTFATL